MRKITAFVLFTLIVVTSCSAQSNNANRLVGSWNNNQDNVQWVFNSNGTGTNGNNSFRYSATETMVAIIFGTGTVYVYYYSVSSDGRTLIIEGGTSGGTSRWLTKQ